MERRERAAAVSSFLLLLAHFVGCSRSDDVVSGPPPIRDSTVVLSTSFEAHGVPTMEGWIPGDTSRVRFTMDVPPAGGSFALEILGLSRSIDWVSRSSPITTGTNYLRLSFWAKKTAGAIPFAFLGLKRGTGVVDFHGVVIVDTVWTSYSIYDTLVAQQGDSLWIQVDGGGGELWEGTTFYDLITLKRYY